MNKSTNGSKVKIHSFLYFIDQPKYNFAKKTYSVSCVSFTAPRSYCFSSSAKVIARSRLKVEKVFSIIAVEDTILIILILRLIQIELFTYS